MAGIETAADSHLPAYAATDHADRRIESTVNYRWIYTYDYASDSVWEPWRECVFGQGGCGLEGVPQWIAEVADDVAARVRQAGSLTGPRGYAGMRGDSHFESIVSVKPDQSGRSDEIKNYILLADSHYAYNGTWDDTAASLRALSERIPLDGIIHLGDLTDGLLPLAQTEEIERRCMADMESLGVPVYIVPGNHDYNYFRGNPEIRYPERPRFFVDIDDSIRLIFIDSFDPKEKARYGFSEECISWLNDALAEMDDGRNAIIFSHVPPLVRLQAWTDNIRGRVELMQVLDRYADRILAFINGHNHCDHLFNDLHNGRFPVISINCAKCEYFTDHKPQGAVVPFRELGSRLQESFDVMQIDASARKLYFIRFGAGEDRVVSGGRAAFCHIS